MVWQLDSATTHVRLSVNGNADLYGVLVDDGPGVAVDNIPMRGCSGQQFTLSPEDKLTAAYAQMDIGLIILQFGGNSVPYLKTSKQVSTYCQSLGRQIDHIRLCCPKAKVLFIGPSDMSTRLKGQLQTYPIIPELIDSSNGIVFQPFDKESLETAITMSMTREWDHGRIARQALDRFSPDTHLKTLVNDIYRF